MRKEDLQPLLDDKGRLKIDAPCCQASRSLVYLELRIKKIEAELRQIRATDSERLWNEIHKMQVSIIDLELDRDDFLEHRKNK